MQQNEIKRTILGYKKDISAESPKTDTLLTNIYPIISQLPEITNPEEFITLEEVLKRSKEFYSKFFTIHEIEYISPDDIQKKYAEMASKTGAEIANIYNSLLNTINPFDLPITLVDGHSMIGEVKKPMILIPDKHFIKEAKVGFSEISLGKELTRLSIATHVHEIGHTQTESIKGYAESYLNKEVVSIFLEKLAALELDPTGNLLRLSERNRYKFICESYLVLNNIPFSLKMGVNKENLLEAKMLIQSTLYATKLFDVYLKAKKPKDKQKIIDYIQAIFDGKITVEEMIAKLEITQGQIKDISLVKRHI